MNQDRPDILEIPLTFPYSSQEWDTIFETLLDLLNEPDDRLVKSAINCLVNALDSEQEFHTENDSPKPIAQRLQSIFAVISDRTLEKPEIFEWFCSEVHFIAENEPYHQLMLEWLGQLASDRDRPDPTPDVLLATQLFLGTYDTSWQAVGERLIDWLDHSDLTVRASAAHQIGLFCSKAFYSKDEVYAWEDDERYERDKRSVIGMPSLEEIRELIRAKELERSGVAGAFWRSSPKREEDAKGWLLDILEQSSTPEPFIPYFPCDLAFDAHERFSQDADAIRRLIDMGRIDIALMAATDESRKIDTLKLLLIEMGNYDSPEIIRIASWHLAYHYHYLHPNGQAFGYVEQITLSEIDLFILFSKQEESESPYAVVIYPLTSDPSLRQTIAQQWVDRIFPEIVRGEPNETLLNTRYYQHGYINYTFESDLVENVIIGYRSSRPWNPLSYHTICPQYSSAIRHG